MIIFIKVILAHLIGDFILQSNRVIKQKEEKKLKSPFLYIHVLIHFLLMMLFLQDFGLVKIALTVTIAHLLIDAFKLILQNANAFFFSRIFIFIKI